MFQHSQRSFSIRSVNVCESVPIGGGEQIEERGGGKRERELLPKVNIRNVSGG